MTDAEGFVENEEEDEEEEEGTANDAMVLVTTLIENDVLELIVGNLKRLNEAEPNEAQGV